MPFLKKRSAERQRDANRTVIMRLLRRYGGLARVELGHHSGLSPATVTAITRELLADGLVREVESDGVEPQGGSRGRPRVGLEVNGEAGVLVVLVVREGQGHWSLADFAGHIIDSMPAAIDHNATEGTALIRAFSDDITRLLARHQAGSKLLGIGICLHGVLDSRAGRVIWSPDLDLHDFHVAAPLRELFGCPVSLVSEANAVTLAIRALPDFQGLQEFACLHLGDGGIGIGLVLSGELYSNSRGFAGEFGHLKYTPDLSYKCRCGADGCIETLVSGWALRRDLGEAPDASPVLPPAEEVKHWFDRAGCVIGTGIAHLVNLLAPERVVLCGPLADYYHWFADPMKSEIRKQVHKPDKALTAIEKLAVDESFSTRGTIAYTLAGGHEASLTAFSR